jgi:uncharacterized membrane protein
MSKQDMTVEQKGIKSIKRFFLCFFSIIIGITITIIGLKLQLTYTENLNFVILIIFGVLFTTGICIYYFCFDYSDKKLMSFNIEGNN